MIYRRFYGRTHSSLGLKHTVHLHVQPVILVAGLLHVLEDRQIVLVEFLTAYREESVANAFHLLSCPSVDFSVCEPGLSSLDLQLSRSNLLVDKLVKVRLCWAKKLQLIDTSAGT